MNRTNDSLFSHRFSAPAGLAALLLCLMALTILPAFAEDGAVPLTPGTETEAAVAAGESILFSFTPESSGTYRFTSLGDDDTFCSLLDSARQMIDSNDDGEDQNFLISCDLTAGETYYFEARYFDSTLASVMRVLLTRFDFRWTLENGTLTVSGTSPMPEYGDGGAPWYDQKDDVTAAVIEEGIPGIAAFAFSGCGNLASVRIPASVQTIGEGAFNECSALTSVTVPSGVTAIENFAFYSCGSLSSLSLPNTLRGIGVSAFSDCSSLTSVTIPAGVSSIGDEAFANCYALETVRIESQEVFIGREAFRNCYSVTGFTAAGSLRFSDHDALKNCSGLADENGFIVIGSRLCAYLQSAVNVEVPAGVKEIGDYVFYLHDTMGSVVLPEGVTAIGDYAFFGCRELMDIMIPSSVTSVSPTAFIGCEQLPEAENGFFIVQNTLVRYTGSEANPVVPDRVTSISSLAFENCASLVSLTIPNGLTSIGEYAFRGCSSLSSVTCANGGQKTVRYDYGAFGTQGSGLYSLSLPASITSLALNAFDGTAMWQRIQPDFLLPENYEGLTVEPEAFSGTSPSYAVIPYSVSTLGSRVFSGCSRLHFVHITNGSCAIADDAFAGCGSGLIIISQSGTGGNMSAVQQYALRQGYQFIADGSLAN